MIVEEPTTSAAKMSSSDSPTMHRSISMPAQPQPLQPKPMRRSQEKETLFEEDYYPESPNCERRKKSLSYNRDSFDSCTQSASK